VSVTPFRGPPGKGLNRWGKAGERLTPEESEKRDRIQAREINEQRAAQAKSEAAARRVWEQGLLRPCWITQALDIGSHEGPEVDIACGAKEPDVDRWEEGELYPTWRQLVLLAELTRHPLAFFARQDTPEVGWTTLELHLKHAGPRKDPVLRFSHTALVMAGIREPDARPAAEARDAGTLF
jgi:hypothetical protein